MRRAALSIGAAIVLALGGDVFAVEGHLPAAQWHQRVNTLRAREQQQAALAKGFKYVGEHPKGYGKVVEFDRRANMMKFVIFLNAADDLGVAIKNLEPGDTVSVTSAAGICSFDDGNGALFSSIAGIVAVGGTALAPEAAVPIEAGRKFAHEFFMRSNDDHPRDAFGRNPQNGDHAEDEGGVLICLPKASGPYYAVESIKDQRERSDDIRPDHVKHGFFLRPDNLKHNTREIEQAGELFIVPWDSEFPDNQGYYEIHLTIKCGRPDQGPPDQGPPTE